MRHTHKLFTLIPIMGLLASLSLAQDPIKQNKKQTVAPAASSNAVVGSGTPGQITKWIGVPGSSIIGDSNITEDKFGKIGIGTKAPTSPLTVQGMIETTLGGIKFPDGTSQTTAGIANIFHDSTLQGNGTAASPLSVGVPLRLSGPGGEIGIITGATTTAGGGAGIVGVGGEDLGLFFGFPVGVIGETRTGIGVFGFSSQQNGVLGRSASLDVTTAAVEGSCTTCTGVKGQGGEAGVFGVGDDSEIGHATGVIGFGGNRHIGGDGMFGVGGTGSGAGSHGGAGIIAARGRGLDGARDGPAGTFVGDVEVQGTLSATTKLFRIDHPLDPENRYLNHVSIESPDMKNLYDGTIVTDSNAEAVVMLPDYFEALNRDVRYQLTVIGTFAQAIVAEEIKGNRFLIRTSAANVKVSWQVTGIRHDAWANRNRVKVEIEKSERERGYYLHPEVFDQPEERSIEWARYPEMMQKLKQQRLEAEAKIQKQQQR